ncbi:MAG: ribonuclease D [Alphaproteobacteria bacterium]|nr:ribonuclease D [Alphaproteobacteria bacterium]
MIIQTQSQLNDICAKLAQKPYITIDTEFLRDKTFYPILCLIQLAAEGIDAVAVDPIEHDLDLSPLHDLLQNENVLKVFHAARQDLEIFYYMNEKIPHPIFDTQVAAMVCGYGDSIAYHRLVQDVTGHALAKNAQFTDWSRRPLSKKQLNYALDDVIFLRDVYKTLDKRLKEQKRVSWLKAEMEILTSESTYEQKPEDIWQRVKIRSDKPKVLAVLRELAKWREETAREKNVPRNRVVKDDALADIAIYMPDDKDALSRIRSLPKDVAKGRGDTILSLVSKAKKSDKSTWPQVKKKDIFPKHATPTLEMLKLLLKINASEADVAAKMIASKSDLETLAVEADPDIAAMKGWRFELFGKDAQALKEGNLTLGLHDGRIQKVSKDA